jgi:chemotaxis protein histidine kinase CheA
MLGVTGVEVIAHHMEDELGTVRRGRGALTSTHIDRYSVGLSAMRLLVHEAVSGTPAAVDLKRVLAQLSGDALEVAPVATPVKAAPIATPVKAAPVATPVKAAPVAASVGVDRDEYPPAMFKENAGTASVRYVLSGDNQGAGATIGNQNRPYIRQFFNAKVQMVVVP